MTSMELLFLNFKKTSHRVLSCGSIVQNEGSEPTEEEISKWSKTAAAVVVDLASLLTKTKEFLENSKKIEPDIESDKWVPWHQKN